MVQLKIIQPLQISVVASRLCSTCFLLFFSQMCSYIFAWTSYRVTTVDLLVVIITVCLLKYTSYKQTQTQVKAQGISDKYILKALLYWHCCHHYTSCRVFELLIKTWSSTCSKLVYMLYICIQRNIDCCFQVSLAVLNFRVSCSLNSNS